VLPLCLRFGVLEGGVSRSGTGLDGGFLAAIIGLSVPLPGGGMSPRK
jgi:hypothetical protein